jgi:hypothetical protein
MDFAQKKDAAALSASANCHTRNFGPIQFSNRLLFERADLKEMSRWTLVIY